MKLSYLFITILYTENVEKGFCVCHTPITHSKETCVVVPQVNGTYATQQRNSIKLETIHIRTSGHEQFGINHDGPRSEIPNQRPENGGIPL